MVEFHLIGSHHGTRHKDGGELHHSQIIHVHGLWYDSEPSSNNDNQKHHNIILFLTGMCPSASSSSGFTK